MHILIKHIAKNIGISLLLIVSIFINFSANSEQSAEEIIKERKALFSKNYKTAKKVQSLSSSGDFDQAKELMIEMSKSYKILLGLFPENSKEGFKTESLPTIWKDKDNYKFLHVDIANFFVSIDREIIKKQLYPKIENETTIKLIEIFLNLVKVMTLFMDMVEMILFLLIQVLIFIMEAKVKILQFLLQPIDTTQLKLTQMIQLK